MLKNIKNIVYIRKDFPSVDEYFMLEINENENILKYINYMKVPEIRKVNDDIALEFIDRLFKIIDSWKGHYESNSKVIDGVSWKLQINYKNGLTKNYSGENSFPNNFDTLDEIKYEIINKLRG